MPGRDSQPADSGPPDEQKTRPAGASPGQAALLNAGDRWGRLQITRFLARGGFGDVYMAVDSKLERTVALKLFRGAGVDALDEARSMGRVQHDNVVTIYDADQVEDSVGIWMEYIDGETLLDYVGVRGRLGAIEAAAIGIEVTRAVAAVHQAKLLHRDISARNVMRDRSGSIVLMDFGLVHARAGPQSDLAGTLPYMAPELLSNGAATHQTDIYALGVLLFFLVTARLPILGRTLEEFKSAHDAGALHKLGDFRPDLDGRLVETIERAMASSPQRRYRTAGELHSALIACIDKPPSSRSRRSVVAAAVLATAGMAGFGVWRWQHLTHPAASPGAKILLPATDTAADPTLDGLSATLRNQLTQSAYFVVIDSSRIPVTLQRMGQHRPDPSDPRTLREIALRNGAKLILFSALGRLGGDYVLNLRLEVLGESPASPVAAWEHVETAHSKTALFDTIRSASNWCRLQIGESKAEITAKDAPPQDITTSSWEALRFYVDAERLADARERENAVLALRRALDLDEDFALARTRLADILGGLSQQEESFQQWGKALELSQRRRLTRREELRIRGGFAQDTENMTVAEAVYRDYCRDYPFEGAPHVYLGNILHRSGRSERGIPELLEAVRLSPDSHVPLANLAYVYITLGRFDDANRIIAQTRARNSPVADICVAVRSVCGGDYPGAAAHLRPLLKNRTSEIRSRAASVLINALSETGNYSAARALAARDAQLDKDDGNNGRAALKIVGMAYQDWRVTGPDAIAHCHEALALDGSAEVALRAATLLARCGSTRAALEIAERPLLRIGAPRFEAVRFRIQGEAHLALRDFKRGLDYMRSADRIEAYWHPRDYLARGLQLAGSLDEALIQYRRLASGHAWFLQSSDHELPGAWTYAMEQYIVVARATGHSEEADSAAQRLGVIRGVGTLIA